MKYLNLDPKLLCVVYRVGMPDCFEWFRSEGMPRDAAQQYASELRAQGNRAMICNYRSSVIIGLPETYGKE